MITRRPAFILAAAAFTAGLGISARAQDAKPATFKAGTVLVLEHVSFDKLMSDPKDKALGDALGMIPARIRELSRESRGQFPAEAASLMNLALTTLAKSGRVAITYNGDNPSGGAFGYGVVASALVGDQAAADQIHAQITGMIPHERGGPRPMPSKRFPGMTDIQTPIATLSFGPRKAADGVRYEIIFGTVENPDAVAEALPKAMNGLEPQMRMRFDLAGIAPALEMAKSFAAQNPQAAEGLAKLDAYGIGSADNVKVSFQSGQTKDESVSYTTIEQARKHAAGLHLGTTPLAAAEFSAVPSDATWVYLHRGSEGTMLDLNELRAQTPEVGKALDQFQGMTGVNPQTDILDALGPTSAVYLSDATGGGGIGSVVVLHSLKDRAKLWAALGKLAAVANVQADKLPIGPGYIRLAASKSGDADVLTLRFPGLPVPLEFTLAVAGDWLVVAPTPQAGLAAIHQISGKGDGGLMSNKTFANSLPSGKKPTSISFSDTSRTLADGYTLLSLFGSAVCNGVRSPTDTARDPGMVIPLYNDLRKGVRPSVSLTYWSGDNLVTESHADHSMLVGAASAGGSLAALAPFIAIPAVMGASRAGAMSFGPVQPASSAYASIAMLFARQSTTPFTTDRALWTLAAQHPEGTLPVQWMTWTPALMNP